MYKISVLIPVYNVEKYLKQCLDSLVNQTLKDIEIICINDGSTDKSGEILDEYSDIYPQLKVIHKENGGYGRAMNIALGVASGEYVGIVESDDFVDCNMFDELYNQAHSTNADIAKSNYWHYERGKDFFVEVLNTFEYGIVFCPRRDNISVFHSLQTIWSAIYRKEFLLDNNILFNETPGASYQDVSFAFKVLACAKRVIFLKEAFLHYRVDNPSSSVKSREKVYCIFDEISNIEQFLNSRQDVKERCMCILAPLKLRLYRENFLRVELRYKMPFLYRATAELQRTAEAGYIKQEYWEESAWHQIQEILKDGNRFLYKVYCNIKKGQIFCAGFWTEIAMSRKIYLYGAGRVARRTLEILRQKKFHVEACFVSNVKENEDYLLDVPIIEYGSTKLNEDDVVLLGIREEYQHEVLYKLWGDGFKNIIPLNREMRNSLEEIFDFTNIL